MVGISIQLPIPTIGDSRAFCPVCKHPADLLGQAYPVRNIYICRQCTERLPIATTAFEQDGDGKIQLRDATDDASLWHERALLMTVIALLKRFAGGCALTVEDIAEDLHLPCGNRPHCRKCQNEARYTASIRASALAHQANKNQPILRMMEFPLCLRCGQIHGRVIEHNGFPATYCQRCDDELAVESFFRNRPIFEDADDEEILERLYKSMPRLFEHGVLPDYWYILRQREDMKNG